jgi:hypothetical protein
VATPVVLPNEFEIDAGYGVIYFETEGGNRIVLKSTIERGDEDIIEICVDDDNFMIQLANDLPVSVIILTEKRQQRQWRNKYAAAKTNLARSS